jgi:hypothetical protein
MPAKLSPVRAALCTTIRATIGLAYIAAIVETKHATFGAPIYSAVWKTQRAAILSAE